MDHTKEETNKMSLKQVLERKLDTLRELNDQPERYLNRFFFELRNEIVLQTEVLLCEQLSERPPPSFRLPLSEHERIINIRRYFFNGFAKLETEFIARIK